jgi:hypothetical protein
MKIGESYVFVEYLCYKCQNLIELNFVLNHKYEKW